MKANWARGTLPSSGSQSTMPIQEVRTMPKDRRQKRDLHALDGNGMVLCNPRDKEAAHRAEMEGIATDDLDAVTCRKCLSLLKQLRQEEKRT
jgi:hypothetical protein